MKTKLLLIISARNKLIAILSLIVIALFAIIGCDNSETPSATTCEFANPLEDLPWLKAQMGEIDLAIEKGNPVIASIYQCIYGNGET